MKRETFENLRDVRVAPTRKGLRALSRSRLEDLCWDSLRRILSKPEHNQSGVDQKVDLEFEI